MKHVFRLLALPLSIVVCLGVSTLPVFAQIYVDAATGNDGNSGLIGFPKQTIQAGVNVATSFQTVNVAAGTYVEAVNITKSLTLLGTSGSASTIISAPLDFGTNAAYNFASALYFTERAIVRVGAASSVTVTINGFTVDGARLGPDATEVVGYSAVLGERCNLTVTNSEIKNMLPADSAQTYQARYNGKGVYLRGSGAVGLITNNTFSNINRYAVYINATDSTNLLPAVFPTANVALNTIIGKGIYNGAQKGVWFNNGAWGTISGNTISNLDYPNEFIESDRGTGITIRRGYLNLSNFNTIENNVITSSTFTNNKGIFDEGINDVITGNTVTGYRFGIQIHNAENVVATGNTVTGGQVGFMVSRTRDPLVGAFTITIGGTPSGKNVITGQISEAIGGNAIALSFRDSVADGTFLSTVPVDARYNDFGVYSEPQIQTRIWDRADTTLAGTDTVYYFPFYTPSSGVTANVKVFLEGPYLTVGDSMGRALKTSGVLATKFPTATVPVNAVDSINIEIRNASTAAGSTVRVFAPAWLMTNGSIRDFADTTKTYVQFLGASAGSYYIVVRHRNHIGIMSAAAEALAVTTTPAVYDFSTAQAKAWGTSPMKATGTRFSMFAGDADGSGDVAALDRTATWNNRNLAGYLGSDVDLSGDVAALDRTLTWNNRNISTQVP